MDKRVGLRLRGRALLVDAVVIFLIWFGFSAITQRLAMASGGPASPSSRRYLGLWFFLLLTPPLAVLAYAACDVFFAATPGKMMLKLRIANDTGRRASTGQLLVRFATKCAPLILLTVWIAYFSVHVAASNGLALNAVARATPFVLIAVGLLTIVVGFGGLIALQTPRQALHDRLARTAVYRAADVTGSSFEPVFDAGAGG
jgi:uncharacterized RDD family membrane protein YckC